MDIARKSNVRPELLLIATFVVVGCLGDRPTRSGDISVADGYVVEIAVEELAAPTMVAFDAEGRMLIAESGYGGAGSPKITQIEADGTRISLVEGEALGDELPVTAVAANEGQIFVVHAGTVSALGGQGNLPVVAGLPGQGDHQANQIVFHEGWMYIAVGTVTNSAVVGTDNAVFGWLKMPERRQLHDVPCEDIHLTNQVFEAESPLAEGPSEVRTSAYAAFGSAGTAGSMVPGDVRCNGAILRARPNGSELEVYAWGFGGGS